MTKRVPDLPRSDAPVPAGHASSDPASAPLRFVTAHLPDGLSAMSSTRAMVSRRAMSPIRRPCGRADRVHAPRRWMPRPAAPRARLENDHQSPPTNPLALRRTKNARRCPVSTSAHDSERIVQRHTQPKVNAGTASPLQGLGIAIIKTKTTSAGLIPTVIERGRRSS